MRTSEKFPFLLDADVKAALNSLILETVVRSRTIDLSILWENDAEG